MRIAFILHQFPALSETFILNQITGLMDRGHTVDIYSIMGPDGESVHPDVISYGLLENVTRIRVPRGWLPRLAGAFPAFLRGFLRNPSGTLRSLNIFRYGRRAASLRLLYTVSAFRRRCDLIHCHFGVLGETGTILREVGNVAGSVVTSFHGFDITRWIRLYGEDVYTELFEKGDLFLPISELWRDQLERLGCPGEKIRVHHMGIDCERFRLKSREAEPGDRVELVSIARFVEKKGLEYGIRAVAGLAKDYPNIRYTIIGDGDLFERMRDLIEELQVSEKIRLTGWLSQEHVLEILDRSHILLAPSVTAADGDREGIPVVLMEAMAIGLPIVSTFHSGIPELVEDGASGRLVPERDEKALGNALRELLDSPGSWAAMGSNGREKVEREFNSRILTGKLEEIYRELTRAPE